MSTNGCSLNSTQTLYSALGFKDKNDNCVIEKETGWFKGEGYNEKVDGSIDGLINSQSTEDEAWEFFIQRANTSSLAYEKKIISQLIKEVENKENTVQRRSKALEILIRINKPEFLTVFQKIASNANEPQELKSLASTGIMRLFLQLPDKKLQQYDRLPQFAPYSWINARRTILKLPPDKLAKHCYKVDESFGLETCTKSFKQHKNKLIPIFQNWLDDPSYRSVAAYGIWKTNARELLPLLKSKLALAKERQTPISIDKGELEFVISSLEAKDKYEPFRQEIAKIKTAKEPRSTDSTVISFLIHGDHQAVGLLLEMMACKTVTQFPYLLFALTKLIDQATPAQRKTIREKAQKVFLTFEHQRWIEDLNGAFYLLVALAKTETNEAQKMLDLAFLANLTKLNTFLYGYADTFISPSLEAWIKMDLPQVSSEITIIDRAQQQAVDKRKKTSGLFYQLLDDSKVPIYKHGSYYLDRSGNVFIEPFGSCGCSCPWDERLPRDPQNSTGYHQFTQLIGKIPAPEGKDITEYPGAFQPVYYENQVLGYASSWNLYSSSGKYVGKFQDNQQVTSLFGKQIISPEQKNLLGHLYRKAIIYDPKYQYLGNFPGSVKGYNIAIKSLDGSRLVGVIPVETSSDPIWDMLEQMGVKFPAEKKLKDMYNLDR